MCVEAGRKTFADGFLGWGPFLPALPLACVHVHFLAGTLVAKDIRNDARGDSVGTPDVPETFRLFWGLESAAAKSALLSKWTQEVLQGRGVCLQIVIALLLRRPNTLRHWRGRCYF